MVEFQHSPTGETGVLSLGGDWPPNRAEELRDALVEGLRLTEHLVVRMQSVRSVSLPFYQLLIAAHRSARTDGKRMSLEGPFPGVVVRGAWVMGILPRTERGERDPDGCLLVEEDGQ